jgi:hypothetical protein
MLKIGRWNRVLLDLGPNLFGKFSDQNSRALERAVQDMRRLLGWQAFMLDGAVKTPL